MFDIGWSEIAVIAVVALIAIGPKELPGVLRMVGQWMGKARKMAAEFQGQFQEAMREAEMADLKKSFDEVKEAASGFTTGNLMTSLERDVSKALDIEGIDKPAATTTETAAIEPPVVPATSGTDATSEIDAPEQAIPEIFTAAEAQDLASQPLAIVREAHAQAEAPAIPAVESDAARDAKAS
jgi:sec-independent protein translocase protein TatB